MPLAEHHVRDEFCCGNDIIDRFVQKRALKDHNADKVRVRVAANEEHKVLGFYSLSLRTLAAKKIGGRIGNTFGNWPIPTVYLSMLGTNAELQGAGLGTDLLLHAFERTLEIAELAGTACMTLDAVDQEKAKWYERRSFQRIEPMGLQMYIPLATLRQACEAAKEIEE